jgi:amidophosphoribosyltransferase
LKSKKGKGQNKMCAIVGVVARSPVSQLIFDALTVLQHRGQDAAGMVTWHNGTLRLRKGNGLVRDVFKTRHMMRLLGNAGIGHVRYPTAGTASGSEAQPFYVNSPYGIALAHNGNLTNASELKDLVYREDLRHINTQSDSEVLLNVFAHELQRVSNSHLTPDMVFKAVRQVHQRCRGAYAVIAMIMGHGIVGFRDPNGIRPLVWGKRETPTGTEYMVASESVALDALGFNLVDDIAAGQALYIPFEGGVHAEQCADAPKLTPCIFEHVYLARPDSIIDKISVYKARLRMGQKLGQKIKRTWSDHDIDVVIPIPDTSRTAAIPLAYELGVKYREGFIKNRYIGRTFIMPGQTQRQKSVRQKLNPIDLEFKDKNVLLIDDSIVRGTTCKEIIQMARDAGAKKVYFASAAPPVRYPNVYGIDMPAAHELIAFGRTEEQICEIIGADRLIYQDLPDLIEAAIEGNSNIERFEASVFDGVYVTEISPEYLSHLERLRSDANQAKIPGAFEEDVLDVSVGG